MATYWSAIDTQHSSYEELKHRKVIAQGWRDLGNLRSLLGPVYDAKDDFLEIVQVFGDNAYSNTASWWHDGDAADRLLRRAPTVMWNLLHLEAGDLVVAVEGRDVRGICEVKEDARMSYQYDTDHEYAHTVSRGVDWIDWTEEQFGFVPEPPSRGLLGIRNLNQASEQVEAAFYSRN